MSATNRRNQDFRDACKRNGIKLWEIAEELHMIDFAFSRLLRYELSKDDKIRIGKAFWTVLSRKTNEEYKALTSCEAEDIWTRIFEL